MAIQFPLAGWAQNINIYEVNIRQYTYEGTFNAFRQHLPRLKEMGIDMLWLMPVTPISVEKRQGTLGSYYATSSYTAVNPEFGTPEDLKGLISDCHDKGIKLIIDWVANHTGCDHEWVTEYPHWYKKDDEVFAILHGWSDVYHLDHTRPEVTEALISAMRYWVEEYDIDGFRCDMAHLVPLTFWEQARKECETIKPLYWLAECEEPEYHAVFDASYAWEWMHASKAKIDMQTTMQHLHHVLHKYLTIPAGSKKLLFTSNHDENSWNGTEYERYGEAAKMLAVFACLFNGVPLIYSGQEKPNLRRIAFFDKDELDWNGDIALYHFYQRSLSLRKQHPAFATGHWQLLPNSNEEHVLSFLAGNEEHNVLVVLNFFKETLEVNVSDEKLNGQYEHLFNQLQFELAGNYFCKLPGYSFNVIYSGGNGLHNRQ